MPSSWWLIAVRRQLGLPRRPDRLKSALLVEDLESREVPTVYFAPDYVLDSNSTGTTAYGSTGPTGLSPAAIRHAYGFDQVSFNGTAGTGAGTTIAIVDAYDDPTIASDLHAFDLQFGLADPTFTKVNQTGGSAMPAASTGWAGEISLDVEWAHAVAPGATILLVEANSASYTDLMSAVDYAAEQTGVVAVSMSFGGGEFSGETSLDSNFLTPTGHTGVAFIASSGDSGAPISYPAASPNVLSVGGTTLTLDSSGNYVSETGWSGSGGGISAYENQPAYQNGVVTQSTTKRTNPDVSYDADPNTGFSVYQTYGNSSSAPWLQYGGTSDAAPQWAALVAIADQGRALAGEAAVSSATLLPAIYGLSASDFHDVTSGTSGGSPNYSAGPGYDLVTGRGSPIANKVIADLVGSGSTAPGAAQFAISAPATATAGTSFSVTVTAENASGAAVTGFTGTVQFSSNDALAGLPSTYTFTAADHGAHTFTVTLKTAGTHTVTVTSGSTTGSSSVTVSPGAATHLTFTQQPSTVVAGATMSAVTVTELDAYGNVATQDNSTQIRLVLGTNTGGATLTGGGPVTVSNGIATFTGLALSKAGTGDTLVATGGTLTSATSSAFTVTPAPSATQFAISAPTTATAGTSFTITVTALDASNNTVTGFNGAVHFTSSDTLAGLPSNYTFTSADHGAHTFTVTLKTAGNETVTATTLTGTVSGSQAVTVSPAAATHLKFIQQPTTTVAATTMTPVTVAEEDAYGNIITQDSATPITLALGSHPAGATLAGTGTVTLSHGVATFTALTPSNAGNFTLVASGGALTGASSTAFTVTPAPSPTQFAISAPGTATAGTSFTITVTAQYASDATATAFTGAVHFTSTDTLAGLPANYTFTPADQGVHTFTVTLKTAGAQAITAAYGTATGTQTVTVSPAAATHLKFIQQPTTTVAATTMTPVTVAEEDAYGNIITQDSATPITLALGSHPAGATLAGTGTVTLSHGVATFTALTPSNAGNFTLVASGGALTGASSTAFTVTPAPSPTQFAISAPGTATAGTSFTITVTAQYASDATATAFTGAVHFTSTDTLAGLPANYTFTPADQGVHTFTVTLKTAGAQAITAAYGTATGTQTVTVSPAAATHLKFTQQPTTVAAGATMATVTVTELDLYGNVVTQDSTTQIKLALGANPGGDTLTGGGFVTVSNGVATFTGLSLNKAGTGFTFVASGGNLSGASSTAFTVTTAPNTPHAITPQALSSTALTTGPASAIFALTGNWWEVVALASAPTTGPRT